MITILIALSTLTLGYGIGYVHASQVEQDKADFWFSWKNPLLYFIMIPAFFICLYQDGWKKTMQEMKNLINDLKESNE